MRHIVYIGSGGDRPGPSSKTTYHLFEPREDSAMDEVKLEKNIKVYPFALSDYEGNGVLNITRKLSCSSFLEPNLELIKKIQPYNWDRFEVVKKLNVKVNRLDNILDSDTEIHELKIDTQGSELKILKGCGDLLKNVTKIICEVEHVELYKNQPLFSDISDYLESFDFKFKTFERVVDWKQQYPIFADAVFVKKNK